LFAAPGLFIFAAGIMSASPEHLVEEFSALLKEVPDADLEKHLANMAVIFDVFLKGDEPKLSAASRNARVTAFIARVRQRCLIAGHRPRTT
jgi:hypothetical protein